MSKEVPQPNEYQLPRSWNKALLPGYEVVAVDQRDPDMSDQVVINPAELPQYPRSNELLNDPNYVHFWRLSLEGDFVYGSFYYRDYPPLVAEDSVEFVDFLQQMIAVSHERVKNGDSDCEFSYKLLVAVQADYRSDPNAAICRLS